VFFLAKKNTISLRGSRFSFLTKKEKKRVPRGKKKTPFFLLRTFLKNSQTNPTLNQKSKWHSEPTPIKLLKHCQKQFSVEVPPKCHRAQQGAVALLN